MVSAASLDGCRLRLARAKTDLDKLQDEISGFINSKPYTVETKVEGDGDLVSRVKVRQHPPVEWGEDAGVIGYRIRSALDHLVYQLVIASGNDPERVSTQFPIFGKHNDYWAGKKHPSKRDTYLAGVDERFRRILDSYQPYQGGGKHHPLAQLAALSNRDKHRHVHIGFAALGAIKVTVTLDGEPWRIVEGKYNRPWRVDDDTALFTFDFRKTPKKYALDSKVEMHPDDSIDVAFADPPITRERFDFIHRYAVEIVGRFEPLIV